MFTGIDINLDIWITTECSMSKLKPPIILGGAQAPYTTHKFFILLINQHPVLLQTLPHTTFTSRDQPRV